MTKAQAMLAVAHGSRDPRHREVITGLVEAVREQRPGLRVETAFLDHCGPTTARALHGLVRDGYQQVKVVPLLLNTAFHVRQDIPAAVPAAHEALPRRWRAGVAKPVLAEPLGPHPLLMAGLERRLREAGVWPGDEEASVVLAWAGSSDRVAVAAVDEVAEGWQRSGWEHVVPVPAVGDLAGEAVRALRGRWRAAGRGGAVLPRAGVPGRPDPGLGAAGRGGRGGGRARERAGGGVRGAGAVRRRGVGVPGARGLTARWRKRSANRYGGISAAGTRLQAADHRNL